MADRSESQHPHVPGDTEGGLENRPATGSDNSAGMATRILAGVLLALVFPWEITRRVVTTAVPRVARLLRDGSAASFKAVGRCALRLAQWLVFIGSRLSSMVRPLLDIGRRGGRGISSGSRVLADWAARAGRRVRAAIKAAAGPVAAVISWTGSAIAAAAHVTHGVGRALARWLGPLASAGMAALRWAAVEPLLLWGGLHPGAPGPSAPWRSMGW
jgi:hypothetical protein